MELILDRKLSDRRLYPALDIPKSGHAQEEKLSRRRISKPSASSAARWWT